MRQSCATAFRRKVLLVALILCISAPAFCAGTPESTLEEMISTDNLEVMLQHLPDSIREAMQGLTPKEKDKVAGELLISKKLAKEGITIRKFSANEWDVMDEKGEVKAHFVLKNTFISGLDALLLLDAGDNREAKLVFITMQLQDGEWRLTGFGAGEQHDVQELLGQVIPGPEQNEQAAVGSLRTLNAALRTYRSTYSEIGYPLNLQALAGHPDFGAPAQHAGLVDDSFLAVPAIAQGYRFEYAPVTSTSYRITARPIEFGKTGKKNFYTDETGMVRFTSEDRAANGEDPPL